MYERKRVKRLSSITTLRSTQPGGNSRNFTNMQPELGVRAFHPEVLGSTKSWVKTGGNKTAKVDKL